MSAPQLVQKAMKNPRHSMYDGQTPFAILLFQFESQVLVQEVHRFQFRRLPLKSEVHVSADGTAEDSIRQGRPDHQLVRLHRLAGRQSASVVGIGDTSRRGRSPWASSIRRDLLRTAEDDGTDLPAGVYSARPVLPLALQ